MLKIHIFSPDEDDMIEKIIETASKAGAGKICNYSGCAFVTNGTGYWKPEEGAHPAVGSVNKVSKEPQVKIEMVCPEESASEVLEAVRSVHPYEEPEINFVSLLKV